MAKGKDKYKGKGVRYISRQLVKAYPKKYKNQREASETSKSILASIKASGGKVTIGQIKELEGKVRVKGIKGLGHLDKKGVPKLDIFLTTPEPYFSLVKYPDAIMTTINTVDFKSELFHGIIKAGQTEIGYYDNTYEDKFAAFVNYINDMQQLREEGDNPYEDEWLVMCTPLIQNKKNGRWVTEIVVVDATGERNNYGFKLDEHTAPTEYIVSGTPLKVVEPEKPTEAAPAVKDEYDKQIELEKQKQRTLQEKVKAIKELKDLGFSNEDIKSALGF